MSKVVEGKKPAGSKLSRAKKTDSSKPKKNNVLNESAEDFVEISSKKVKIPTDKIVEEKISQVESVAPAQVTGIEALPKCRFCGKTFPLGQELKW